MVSAAQRFGYTEHEVLISLPGVNANNANRRMNIYAQGYVLRLLECLRADFPVLSAVMGDEVFNFFAQAYISTFPSVSPTLFDLGAGFANFLLQSQRHASAHQEASEIDFFKFPVELAKLERARTEVIRAPGLESQAISLSAYSALDILMGESETFTLAPCTRLLALSFPMVDFWETTNRGGEDGVTAAIPEPASSFVVIARKNYRVNLYALHEWQYHFLLATQKGNITLHESARHAACLVSRSFDSLLAQLIIWLPIAIETGMISKSKSGLCD